MAQIVWCPWVEEEEKAKTDISLRDRDYWHC